VDERFDEFFLIGFEDRRGLVEERCTRGWRESLPSWLRIAGGGDGGVHVGDRSIGDLREFLSCGRVDVDKSAPPFGGAPCAINEKLGHVGGRCHFGRRRHICLSTDLVERVHENSPP